MEVIDFRAAHGLDKQVSHNFGYGVGDVMDSLFAEYVGE